jgi:hypothetical protein
MQGLVIYTFAQCARMQEWSYSQCVLQYTGPSWICITYSHCQGGFTPLGLTLMQILAQRAAHIIALSPAPVRDPEIDTLISLWQSTISAVQSVLHVLFLPTPFKSTPRQGTDAPEEVLKAGSLYRECAVVNLRIPSPATADAGDAQVPDDGSSGACILVKRWGRVLRAL